MSLGQVNPFAATPNLSNPVPAVAADPNSAAQSMAGNVMKGNAIAEAASAKSAELKTQANSEKAAYISQGAASAGKSLGDVIKTIDERRYQQKMQDQQNELANNMQHVQERGGQDPFGGSEDWVDTNFMLDQYNGYKQAKQSVGGMLWADQLMRQQADIKKQEFGFMLNGQGQTPNGFGNGPAVSNPSANLAPVSAGGGDFSAPSNQYKDISLSASSALGE